MERAIECLQSQDAASCRLGFRLLLAFLSNGATSSLVGCDAEHVSNGILRLVRMPLGDFAMHQRDAAQSLETATVLLRKLFKANAPIACHCASMVLNYENALNKDGNAWPEVSRSIEQLCVQARAIESYGNEYLRSGRVFVTFVETAVSPQEEIELEKLASLLQSRSAEQLRAGLLLLLESFAPMLSLSCVLSHRGCFNALCALLRMRGAVEREVACLACQTLTQCLQHSFVTAETQIYNAKQQQEADSQCAVSVQEMLSVVLQLVCRTKEPFLLAFAVCLVDEVLSKIDETLLRESNTTKELCAQATFRISELLSKETQFSIESSALLVGLALRLIHLSNDDRTRECAFPSSAIGTAKRHLESQLFARRIWGSYIEPSHASASPSITSFVLRSELFQLKSASSGVLAAQTASRGRQLSKDEELDVLVEKLKVCGEATRNFVLEQLKLPSAFPITARFGKLLQSIDSMGTLRAASVLRCVIQRAHANAFKDLKMSHRVDFECNRLLNCDLAQAFLLQRGSFTLQKTLNHGDKELLATLREASNWTSVSVELTQCLLDSLCKLENMAFFSTGSVETIVNVCQRVFETALDESSDFVSLRSVRLALRVCSNLISHVPTAHDSWHKMALQLLRIGSTRKGVALVHTQVSELLLSTLASELTRIEIQMLPHVMKAATKSFAKHPKLLILLRTLLQQQRLLCFVGDSVEQLVEALAFQMELWTELPLVDSLSCAFRLLHQHSRDTQLLFRR
ncbi:MAG: hypothetical protein MHM6MM_004420, partial [Cercozoa sp. M6MM]